MSAPILQGKRLLITSGPMRAPIDAIRYLANTSTGQLGSLLAEEALGRGAEVTFVCGPGGLHPGVLASDWKNRLFIQEVVTFDDLMKVMSQELGGHKYHVVLHAMAVLDYVPEKRSAEKTPSGLDQWTIQLLPTPKIIQMIKRWDPQVFLVGFKLEVGAGQEELIQAARCLAEQSQADLVVANELDAIQRGEHWALVVDAGGGLLGTFRGKAQIARGLLDLVETKLKGS